MDNLDLEAIEARLKAIKPYGLDDEWRAELYEKNEPVAPDGWIVFGGDDSLEASICQVYGGNQDPEAISKFIAAARQDVPALIAELRRLQAAALPVEEQGPRPATVGVTEKALRERVDRLQRVIRAALNNLNWGDSPMHQEAAFHGLNDEVKTWDVEPAPKAEEGKAEPRPWMRNSDLLLEVEKVTETIQENPLSDRWEGACVAIRCKVNAMRCALLVKERAEPRPGDDVKELTDLLDLALMTRSREWWQENVVLFNALRQVRIRASSMRFPAEAAQAPTARSAPPPAGPTSPEFPTPEPPAPRPMEGEP